MKQGSSKAGCLSLIVIMLAIFVIVASCSAGDNNSKRTPKYDKAGASVMAEEFVKDKLGSPGSAKFEPYLSRNITDLGNGKFKIQSYVDSQNDFGALKRSYYTIVVKYVSDDKWTMESLVFQKQ